MLIVISPAKKLDFDTPAPTNEYSQPQMLDQSQQLIDELRELDSFQIASLMKLSMKLADLNADRFQSWHTPFTPDNAKQAMFAFHGDVYQGMDAASFSAGDIDFAQQHLRILSGLYGILRPLDLMQAYRLEMGTRFANTRGRNLYEFWGNMITDAINDALAAQGDDVLINLASQEYFSAIDTAAIHGRIITPVFKEYSRGAYRIISFNAKKARGYMSRFIITKGLTQAEDLKAFDTEGYAFNATLSSEDEWVFTR